MPLLINKRTSKHSKGERFQNDGPQGMPLTILIIRKSLNFITHQLVEKWRAKMAPGYHGLSHLQASGTPSQEGDCVLSG